MDDPHTYDITEFAREFTWALIFWNAAEHAAKTILAHLLGGGNVATAIAADMKNRRFLQGIEAAGRELEDAEMRDHLAHFSKGFGILLGYRNLYVHNMVHPAKGAEQGDNIKTTGMIYQLKGEGQLRYIYRPVDMAEIKEFRTGVMALSSYGAAIGNGLGIPDYEISELLEMPE